MIRPIYSEQFFVCDCGDHEHMMIVAYSHGDDSDPYVYVDMHIVKGNLFNRITVAVKYVLGLGTDYGHWHEILLDPAKTKQLVRHLEGKLKDNDMMGAESVTTISSNDSLCLFEEEQWDYVK